jgi:hypothetical protein
MLAMELMQAAQMRQGGTYCFDRAIRQRQRRSQALKLPLCLFEVTTTLLCLAVQLGNSLFAFLPFGPCLAVAFFQRERTVNLCRQIALRRAKPEGKRRISQRIASRLLISKTVLQGFFSIGKVGRSIGGSHQSLLARAEGRRGRVILQSEGARQSGTTLRQAVTLRNQITVTRLYCFMPGLGTLHLSLCCQQPLARLGSHQVMCASAVISTHRRLELISRLGREIAPMLLPYDVTQTPCLFYLDDVNGVRCGRLRR